MAGTHKTSLAARRARDWSRESTGARPPRTTRHPLVLLRRTRPHSPDSARRPANLCAKR